MREEISDGSDIEEEHPHSHPKRIQGIIYFQRRLSDNQSTWMAACQENNVPVRTAISGSVVSELATIEMLFGNGPLNEEGRTFSWYTHCSYLLQR